MKKASLYLQLALINAIPVLAVICLWAEFPYIGKFCPFGAGVYIVFAALFIMNHTAVRALILLLVLAVNILLNISAVVSFKKNRCNYVIVTVLIIDMILSLISGMFLTVVLDFFSFIFIIGFADKAKRY